MTCYLPITFSGNGLITRHGSTAKPGAAVSLLLAVQRKRESDRATSSDVLDALRLAGSKTVWLL
jgi:hypothetical protein